MSDSKPEAARDALRAPQTDAASHPGRVVAPGEHEHVTHQPVCRCGAEGDQGALLRGLVDTAAGLFSLAGSNFLFRGQIGYTHCSTVGDPAQRATLAAAMDLCTLLELSPQGREALANWGRAPMSDSSRSPTPPWHAELDLEIHFFGKQLDDLTNAQAVALCQAANLMHRLFGLMAGLQPSKGDDVCAGRVWPADMPSALQGLGQFAEQQGISPGRLVMFVEAANALFGILEREFTQAPGAPA